MGTIDNWGAASGLAREFTWGFAWDSDGNGYKEHQSHKNCGKLRLAKKRVLLQNACIKTCIKR